MTLAGPATESSTYVLLAPVLAVAVLTVADRPAWQRFAVRGSFVLFVAAAVVVWFPGSFAGPIQATSIQPFAGLLLTVHVGAEYRRAIRPQSAQSGSGADLQRAA
jgi:hypothetical protein